VVEHLLAKEKVAGSNPVFRSRYGGAGGAAIVIGRGFVGLRVANRPPQSGRTRSAENSDPR
jgi:hypothetical protein